MAIKNDIEIYSTHNEGKSVVAERFGRVLKALKQPSRKFCLFFYSNFYLHFLRPCCENIIKIVGYFLRKLGNNSHNFTYCSSLQPVVVYSFSEIESTFPKLF